MSEDPDIVAMEEVDLQGILDQAAVMAPAIGLGANVKYGVNEFVTTDEEVCTVEFLLNVPTEDGDALAIMPIIMSPELGNSLGLVPTELPQEETE